jgi:hypothetical protein
MPKIRELESKLVALRREIADAKRSGFTPLQLRKLQADCWQLWAALEQYKYGHAVDVANVRH